MRKTAFALVLAGLIPAAAFSQTEASSPAGPAYAQGRELLARRGSDDLRAAVQEFAKAIAADPTFAPAFAGLAETRALLFDYVGAREAALRAVALDERQAGAHAVLGFVRLHADWDWSGAEGDLRRALELDPRAATPHLWYAIVLEATGRSEEAVAEARRAVEIEPRKAHVRAGLGYRLYWARRYDEAVAELTAALDLDPNLETAHYFIGRARVQQGRFAEARTAYARARKLSPEDPNLKSAEAYLEARAGRRKESDRRYYEVERLALRGLPFCTQVAGIRLATGDRDAALRWLERAHDGHEGSLVWLKIDPRFDALQGEPRFTTILQRMGLLAGQSPANSSTEVQLTTSDQITIYGDLYETDPARPLIVLVHQGDGNVRGEYAPIVPRLRDAGFDILAIDSRLGGSLFDATNRTVDRNPIRDWKYCDAYPDLVAALDSAKARAKDRKVVLWGSSYSATLALRLAAERPGDVAAVLAFSPASGPAMGDCQPVPYAAQVKIPVLVVRPKKELDEPLRRDDFEAFQKQGHETWVADPGEHGSSTLVADRAGGDVSATWSAVLEFLRKVQAR